MLWSYQKNQEAFRKQLSEPDSVAWSGTGVMIGALCLHPIALAFTCYAAGDDALGDSMLQRSRARTEEAFHRFGASAEFDDMRLDRMQIALSDRVELAAGTGSQPFGSVPFDSVRTYFFDNGRVLEEKNAAQLYWAVFALLEGDHDQYRRALELKTRKHRDFVSELAMLPKLPDMLVSDAPEEWLPFEEVMSCWLNPTLLTDSFASNFQTDFAFLLSLFWCKYRLRSVDRDVLLRTYLGETLSVPVAVA
jgi:hypothetical protein